MNFFTQQIENWSLFAKAYNMDPSFGYLTNPNTQVTSFSLEKVMNLVQEINSGLTGSHLIERILNFPDIELQQARNATDELILHNFLIAIANVYFCEQRLKKKADHQIIVPRNLAQPLYTCAKQLEFKVGMNVSISYMWKPINQIYLQNPDEFSLEDFELRMYLTGNKKQQNLFFGGSIIGAFHLAKINKLIYGINAMILSEKNVVEIIKRQLQKCSLGWRKIIFQNQKVIVGLDPKFFYNVLRPRVTGFMGVIFEGVDKGENLAVTSTGGTGGNDPSFQIFERGFGITFDGFFKHMQDDLKTGMTKDHKNLIKYYEENSKIRSYCQQHAQLRPAYNLVLIEYANFLKIHTQFIMNFIMANLSHENPESKSTKKKTMGTAGTPIENMLKRYKEIEHQLLAL